MVLEEKNEFKINDIFFLSDNSTILVVKNNFRKVFLNLNIYNLLLDGVIIKTIKINKELILKNQTINNNTIALETCDDLSELKNIDFKEKVVSLSLNSDESKKKHLFNN